MVKVLLLLVFLSQTTAFADDATANFTPVPAAQYEFILKIKSSSWGDSASDTYVYFKDGRGFFADSFGHALGSALGYPQRDIFAAAAEQVHQAHRQLTWRIPLSSLTGAGIGAIAGSAYAATALFTFAAWKAQPYTFYDAALTGPALHVLAHLAIFVGGMNAAFCAFVTSQRPKDIWRFRQSLLGGRTGVLRMGLDIRPVLRRMIDALDRLPLENPCAIDLAG